MMQPTEVNERLSEARSKLEEAKDSLGEAYDKLSELMKSGVVLPGLGQFATSILSSQVEVSAGIGDLDSFREMHQVYAGDIQQCK